MSKKEEKSGDLTSLYLGAMSMDGSTPKAEDIELVGHNEQGYPILKYDNVDYEFIVIDFGGGQEVDKNT